MRHIPPHTFVCLGVSRPSAIVKAWPGHQSSEGIIQTSKHTTWLTGDSPAHSVVGHRGQKYWILIFLILYLSSYILVTILFKTQFTYWTWLTKRKPMKTSDCFGYFNYATSWGWASQTKILPSVVWKVWLKHKRLKPDCPTVAEWSKMDEGEWFDDALSENLFWGTMTWLGCLLQLSFQVCLWSDF